MAADEDMAVRFYKVGDAADLANQLITILKSPELQRSMARQNFAAGLEMTIGKVVRNYLRWFELNKYKKELANSPEYKAAWDAISRQYGAADVRLTPDLGSSREIHGREAAASSAQSIDFVDPLA
jgi:hypothetical protein